MINRLMKSGWLLLPLMGMAASVQAAADEFDPITQGANDLLIYGALALGIFALLIGFWALIAALKNQNIKKQLAKNEHDLDRQYREIESLERRLNAVEGTLRRLEQQREETSRREMTNAAVNSRRLVMEEYVRPEPVAEPPQPSLSQQITMKCDEFTQAYNQFQQLTGYEAKAARDELQRKYGLRGFKCINSTERVNHQDIPPKFQEAGALTEADLWGFSVNTSFIMAPNVRGYESSYHDNAGMKELFKSNFVHGNTYGHIEMRRPAIMNGDLQIVRKGDLQLS